MYDGRLSIRRKIRKKKSPISPQKVYSNLIFSIYRSLEFEINNLLRQTRFENCINKLKQMNQRSIFYRLSTENFEKVE